MKAPEKEILGTKIMNHRHRPKITALVVDDNMVIRAIHHRLLKDLGIENQVAVNGKEAVDVHSSGQYFDLILMDMDMPVMNGIEVLLLLLYLHLFYLIVTIKIYISILSIYSVGTDSWFPLQAPVT